MTSPQNWHMMCTEHFYEYIEQQQEGAIGVMIHRQHPFARQLTFSPSNYVAALENHFVNSTNIVSAEPLAICPVVSVPPLKAYHPT